MLKLYQFPHSKHLPSHSHYCTKLELYLKIAQIPYENIYTLNFSKNPKKQMPYVELDGEIIGDSSFIIERLVSKYGDKVDHWLTAEQKAVAVTLQRLLENHLALIMMYFRWTYPQGWQQFKQILFGKAPWFVKFFIADRLAKKVTKRLGQEQAIRHFSVDELLARAKVDLDALSAYLGNKSFVFGDRLCSVDCLLFAVYSAITMVNFDSPLKVIAVKYSNLTQHSDKILQQYYSN